jgi:hypothetical protein
MVLGHQCRDGRLDLRYQWLLGRITRVLQQLLAVLNVLVVVIQAN